MAEYLKKIIQDDGETMLLHVLFLCGFFFQGQDVRDGISNGVILITCNRLIYQDIYWYMYALKMKVWMKQ